MTPHAFRHSMNADRICDLAICSLPMLHDPRGGGNIATRSPTPRRYVAAPAFNQDISRAGDRRVYTKAREVRMTVDISQPYTDEQTTVDGTETSWRSRRLVDILQSEDLSRSLLEDSRWPDGPACVKCGAHDKGCRITSRAGLWSCKACRNCQYSVTSGTALHGTRVEISKWVTLFALRHIWRQPVSGSSLSLDFQVSYLTARRMIQKMEELEITLPAMTARLELNLRTLL